MELFYGLCWFALLIAMAGDIAVSLILPAFYKGYIIPKMSISALGNPQSPVRVPFIIWMLIEGILFLLGIPAFLNAFMDLSKGLTITAAVFIAVFAVGACIFTCFFSVNESKDVVTVASKIHGAGSVTGFMLMLFLPLLIAKLSDLAGDPAILWISIVCFVLALITFALFVMSDKERFKGTVIANEGLWQRLNLVFMYIPLAAVAIRNIR